MRNIELRSATTKQAKWFNILVNEVLIGYCYEEIGSNGLWKICFNNDGLTRGFGNFEIIKKEVAKYFNISIQDIKITEQDIEVKYVRK